MAGPLECRGIFDLVHCCWEGEQFAVSESIWEEKASLKASLKQELLEEILQEMQKMKADLRKELLEASQQPASLQAVWTGDLDLEATTSDKPEQVNSIATFEQSRGFYEEGEEFVVSESMWEALLLAWTPAVGLGGSVMLSLGVLLNIFVQLTFVSMAVQFFADPSRQDFNAGSVGDAEFWRLTEAHSTKRMDEVGWVSLGTRVCNRDGSLVLSGAQVGMVQEMHDYLNLMHVSDSHQGVMLACLCLILWYFTVAQELSACVDMANALFRIQGSGYRSIMVVTPEGNFAFEAIGTPRRVLVLLCLAMRISLAVVLLIAGGQWLSWTPSLTDLILNAAALAFVLDLDELLFAALTPPLVKRCVSQLTPLKCKAEPALFGMGMKAPLILLGAIIFCTAMLNTGVVPLKDIMVAVNSTMCAGSMQFVVDRNWGLGYPIAVSTNPFGAIAPKDSGLLWNVTKELNASRYDSKAKMDRLAADGRREANHQKAPALLVRRKHFTSEIARGIDGMSPSPVCWDALFFVVYAQEPYLPFLTELRFTTGNLNGQVCDDFKEYCARTGARGDAVRGFCSKTCQCDTHEGLIAKREGCSGPCLQQLQKELIHHNESFFGYDLANCRDKPREIFQRAGIAQMLQDLRTEFQFTTPVAEITARGCEAFLPSEAEGVFLRTEAWVPDALCGRVIETNLGASRYEHSQITSLRWLCPVACGCSISFGIDCPRSCLLGAHKEASDPCALGLCQETVRRPHAASECRLADEELRSGGLSQVACESKSAQLGHRCCGNTTST